MPMPMSSTRQRLVERGASNESEHGRMEELATSTMSVVSRLGGDVRLSVLCVLGAISATAGAAGFSCVDLNSQTAGPDQNFRPPVSGEVIGRGRVALYSAPSKSCRNPQVAMARGESLTVYKPYKDWLNVMYVSKGGQDFTGWVRSSRVRLGGRYGAGLQTPNSSREPAAPAEAASAAHGRR